MAAPNEQADKSQELIFEYDQLRKEILHNDAVSLQILGATVVISASIMSITFSEAVKSLTTKGLLCFMAEAVVFIALWQVIDRARSSYLIASYLRIFTEAKMNYLNWENRLARFRQLFPGKGYGRFVNYQLWTYAFFMLVYFILGSWYMWQRYSSSHFCIVVASLILGAISTFVVLVISRYRFGKYVLNHKDYFDPRWLRIRDEENAD